MTHDCERDKVSYHLKAKSWKDVIHHIKSREHVGWSCFLMAVNQSFYNVIMTSYISKHNDSTHILSCCLISLTVPCLSIPLIHATCPAHFHRQDTNCTTRKWPLHATLFTATDTDYTPAIYRRLYAFNEQERLPFPLSPLGYIQMGRILFFFFFLRLRNKT